MKKQILSAVLLTAMVGVSVAEAGFTDDLRAKLVGKDFTMQYVQKYDFANPNIADVGDKFTFTRQGKNFAVKHDFAKYVKQGNAWKLNGYTNHKTYMESINGLPDDYPYYDVRDAFMNSFYAEYDGWHYDVKTGYDVAAVVDVRGREKLDEYIPVMCDSSTVIKILLLGENKGKLPKPEIKNVKYDGENVVVEEYEIPLFEQDYNGVRRIICYGHHKNIKQIINSMNASGGLVAREIKQTVRMYYRADGSLVYFDAITSNPNGAKYRVDFINHRVDNSLFDYVKKFPVDKTKSKSLVKAQ